MDFNRLLGELKKRDDEELCKLSRSYGVNFTREEVQQLRPLLEEVSMHWILTGIPETFISKVTKVLGESRTSQLLDNYLNMKK